MSEEDVVEKKIKILEAQKIAFGLSYNK